VTTIMNAANTIVETTLIINGESITRRIPVRQNLVDFLREEMGLTGTHIGCEHGVCGACTVRVDGKIVRGCLMLAVQAEGRTVETVEGLSDSGEIADLQNAFHKRNAASARRACCLLRRTWLRATRAPRVNKSVNTSPETTAAAPAIKPSSMPLKPCSPRAGAKREWSVYRAERPAR
jgi:hypothetical protein